MIKRLLAAAVAFLSLAGAARADESSGVCSDPKRAAGLSVPEGVGVCIAGVQKLVDAGLKAAKREDRISLWADRHPKDGLTPSEPFTVCVEEASKDQARRRRYVTDGYLDLGKDGQARTKDLEKTSLARFRQLLEYSLNAALADAKCPLTNDKDGQIDTLFRQCGGMGDFRINVRQLDERLRSLKIACARRPGEPVLREGSLEAASRALETRKASQNIERALKEADQPFK